MLATSQRVVSLNSSSCLLGEQTGIFFLAELGFRTGDRSSTVSCGALDYRIGHRRLLIALGPRLHHQLDFRRQHKQAGSSIFAWGHTRLSLQILQAAGHIDPVSDLRMRRVQRHFKPATVSEGAAAL
jgi:hypothetical protein